MTLPEQTLALDQGYFDQVLWKACLLLGKVDICGSLLVGAFAR